MNDYIRAAILRLKNSLLMAVLGPQYLALGIDDGWLY